MSRVNNIEIGRCCRLTSTEADAETESHHNNFNWHFDLYNVKMIRENWQISHSEKVFC